MSTIRFFSGSRAPGGRSPVVDSFKLGTQGKGKQATSYKHLLNRRMETAQGISGMALKAKRSAMVDYKNILKKKLQENKAIAMDAAVSRFRSKRAEQALKEMAMKQAAKEAKKMRQMVVVQPRNFHNGSINKRGQIYDVASNLVGKVNTKNGNIATLTGWSIGKYRPNHLGTNVVIQDAINKYSPYYINLRKMQMMQQGMNVGEEVINVYGYAPPASQTPQSLSDYYGSDVSGPRQNVGMTAWGAMSNNAWGTFADNAWGTSSDNVWGTVSTDVWGGIGGGNLWGVKGPNIWGTGSGTNYIKGITSFLAALFGLKTKGGREARRQFIAQRTGSGRSNARSAAPTTRR